VHHRLFDPLLLELVRAAPLTDSGPPLDVRRTAHIMRVLERVSPCFYSLSSLLSANSSAEVVRAGSSGYARAAAGTAISPALQPVAGLLTGDRAAGPLGAATPSYFALLVALTLRYARGVNG
jgi:hypothetical protein